MSYRIAVSYIVVLAGILALSVSCSHTPGRIYPSPISASSAGNKAIEMFDTNKDNKISGAELDKCPGLKAAVTKVDPGNEGVTAEMVSNRIKAWQNSKLGRMSLACTVTRNGRGFEGAEVKFVPEKFLGLDDPKWIASGKTDMNGMVMLSVPTSGEREDPPGVPPGFYRVEITKPGMNIPAKYNTETILGQEVANDAVGIMEGIRFDLKF
jgi:hypothetical protein